MNSKEKGKLEKSPVLGNTVKVRKSGLINFAKVCGISIGDTASASPHSNCIGNFSWDKLSNHLGSNLQQF